MNVKYEKTWVRNKKTRNEIAESLMSWRSNRDSSPLDFRRTANEIELSDGRTFAEAVRDHRLWSNTAGSSGYKLILKNEDLSWIVAPRINLSGARFENVKVRNSNLIGASMVCCWFKNVDFSNANMKNTVLSSAQFHKSDFTRSDLSKSRVDKACFSRCLGLHGSRKATDSCLVYGELAIASKERFLWHSPGEETSEGVRVISHGSVSDGLEYFWKKKGNRKFSDIVDVSKSFFELITSWDILRSVGGLFVVGSAAASVSGIVAYATFQRWYNEIVPSLHKRNVSSVLESCNEIQHKLELLSVDKKNIVECVMNASKEKLTSILPHSIPLPSELVLLLIAFGLLGMASIIYTLWCPRIVKENTDLRWTRELKFSPLEYASAKYDFPIARHLAAFLYLVGGGYIIGYIVIRSCSVIWRTFVM